MKTITVQFRMTEKLYKELKEHSDKEDEGVVSITLRKAIRNLIKNYDTNTNI